MTTKFKRIVDSSINEQQFVLMTQSLQHLLELRKIRNVPDYSSYRKLQTWLEVVDDFLLENDLLMDEMEQTSNVHILRKHN